MREPAIDCPGWDLIMEIEMAGTPEGCGWWHGEECPQTLSKLADYLRVSLVQLKDINLWGGQTGPGLINSFGVNNSVRLTYYSHVTDNAHAWLDNQGVTPGRPSKPENGDLIGAAIEHLEKLLRWVSDEAADTDQMPKDDVAHSTDFRSVRWFRKRYTFTTTQAACVDVLWQNWQQGTPVISEVTILDAAGSGGDRLRDVFDKGKHPAWGTMIVPAGKGAFRLMETKKS